ncbi:MAG: hypothetical protein H7245_16695 [Candidatus Saccharibacteria bacterium]|nr:hypothetical protein [Pseudorhodobacter sp.]
MNDVQQNSEVVNLFRPASSSFWPKWTEGPFLLRDVTMLTFSVTFLPEVISRMLPDGLRSNDEATGGFEFLLARRGHMSAPFSAATIWIDLETSCGDHIAPRYAVARFASRTVCDQSDVIIAQTRFCEDELGMSVELSIQDRSIVHATVAGWCDNYPAGGTNTYLTPDSVGSSSLVVPWSANLADANMPTLEVRDPVLAAFAPISVFGATLGREAALTLGIIAGPR